MYIYLSEVSFLRVNNEIDVTLHNSGIFPT